MAACGAARMAAHAGKHHHEPAGLAVLPRQRGQRRSLPRVWRLAGQQFVGGRFVLSRRRLNSRWENMFGGDGFWMWEDPSDPTYIYAEAQGGEIGRVNRYTHETAPSSPIRTMARRSCASTGTRRSDEPQREGHDLHRRAVPVPLARPRANLGAHLARPDHQRSREAEAGGVGRHHGGQLRRRNAHHDLLDFGVAEERTVIWVGTDDGNVQVTRDGGKTWTNVGGNVAGPGKAPWVSWVEAGRFAEGTAYATFDRHMYGDMKPYVYKTTDYGKTWTALPVQQAACAAMRTSSRKTRNPNLLFLGTEFGLWISRRRAALGAVQRQRLPRRGGARHRGASARPATWCWPRTDAASGSSTTSRRCARSPTM
jgi:hypothetical protein